MLSIQHFRNGTYRGSTRHHRYGDHPGRGRRGSLVFCESRRDFHGFGLMSVVIDAENISKRFFLGERNQRAFFEDVAAKSVVVGFDYDAGPSTEVPERWRRRLESAAATGAASLNNS